MTKISKAFEKRLNKMKPTEAILVRVDTTDLNQTEIDLKIFNISYQLSSEYSGYIAGLTKEQIVHFAKGDYPYITSITDDSHNKGNISYRGL